MQGGYSPSLSLKHRRAVVLQTKSFMGILKRHLLRDVLCIISSDPYPTDAKALPY